ncbi:tyrosine-type recombinase/integrase [Flavobacterium sp. I3-2]|uniref:tyrosine-type recombinase/integrase n=1 Tax=Flavobacterium sp. I3-2 TaxID=2748319 RepID=UPI0015AD9CC6|nr:site-specific integrase [Flavobacterium sp. I3-2]
MIKLKIKKSNFTTPIVTKNGDYQIIQFRYDGVRFRMSFDLNKIKDKKLRDRQFEIYRAEIERKLLQGWNPNENEDDEVKEVHYNSLSESLKFALEKKEGTVRESTFKDYETTVNKFIEQSNKAKLADADIKDLTRKDILNIFSSMTAKYKWSNKTYNKYLGNIRTLFSVLTEWEYIGNNICRDISLKKTTQSDFYEPANDLQLKLIKDKLNVDFSNLWDFVFFLFQTGLRPHEILLIQLKMIDLKNRVIILPKGIIKTSIKRIVPIDDYIYEYLLNKNLQNYHSDFYLFGTNRKFKNKGVSNETDLIPAADPLSRKTISKWWQRKVEIPLGIDVKLYSFKHLTANKRLEAGQSLDDVQHLFGHTNKAMTRVYATHLTNIYVDKLKQNKLSLNDMGLLN